MSNFGDALARIGVVKKTKKEEMYERICYRCASRTHCATDRLFSPRIDRNGFCRSFHWDRNVPVSEEEVQKRQRFLRNNQRRR